MHACADVSTTTHVTPTLARGSRPVLVLVHVLVHEQEAGGSQAEPRPSLPPALRPLRGRASRSDPVCVPQRLAAAVVRLPQRQQQPLLHGQAVEPDNGGDLGCDHTAHSTVESGESGRARQPALRVTAVPGPLLARSQAALAAARVPQGWRTRTWSTAPPSCEEGYEHASRTGYVGGQGRGTAVPTVTLAGIMATQHSGAMTLAQHPIRPGRPPPHAPMWSEPSVRPPPSGPAPPSPAASSLHVAR
jgi:hypothetical protein